MPQTPIDAMTQNVNDDAMRLAQARFAQHLRRLNEIGMALSAERDIESLLEKILSGSRELTQADAGSLFLVNTSGTPNMSDDTLYFCKAQNHSLTLPREMPQFAVSPLSLAGYVALTGESLSFPDVYHLPPDAPYKFNPSFDRRQGYHTRSVLVAPMKNQAGAIIGVLQLINCKRDANAVLSDEKAVEAHVVPFDQASIELAASLASQAAVALENNRLLKKLHDLINSFIVAASDAIEDRDPSTAGHSKRVTTLTVALAQAANDATAGPFAEVRFTPEQLLELQYAGWLHDFGKIGVRESVLTKSHKLEPMHCRTVKDRLFLLRQSTQTDFSQKKIEVLLAHRDLPPEKRDERDAELARLHAEMKTELARIDDLNLILTRANDPSVTWLPDEEFERQQRALDTLLAMNYVDAEGQAQPLLTAAEHRALQVRKGSLTPDEYKQIQDHARLSYEFLNKISWTPDFASIPDIAHCHHEKLNGKGYPRGILANQITLQSRMMTVADIYDALTASDRPYKKALPVERALQILQMEVKDGHLDPDVVALFVAQKIYLLNNNGES